MKKYARAQRFLSNSELLSNSLSIGSLIVMLDFIKDISCRYIVSVYHNISVCPLLIQETAGIEIKSLQQYAWSEVSECMKMKEKLWVGQDFPLVNMRLFSRFIEE